MGAREKRESKQAERAKGTIASRSFLSVCVCVLFPSLFPLPSPSLLSLSLSLFLSLFLSTLLPCLSLSLSLSLLWSTPTPPPNPSLPLIHTHTIIPPADTALMDTPFGLSNYPISLPPPHTRDSGCNYQTHTSASRLSLQPASCICIPALGAPRDIHGSHSRRRAQCTHAPAQDIPHAVPTCTRPHISPRWNGPPPVLSPAPSRECLPRGRDCAGPWRTAVV